LSRALNTSKCGKHGNSLRHPYILLFYALLIKVAQWQYDAGQRVPTDFVFDEQGSVGAEAVAFYSYYKRIQKPEIAALMGSTPIFRDDKLILPLQAADMVAWHKRRRIENPDELDADSPTALLEDLNYAEVHLDRKFLYHHRDGSSETSRHSLCA
jgi:hypothetical protein